MSVHCWLTIAGACTGCLLAVACSGELAAVETGGGDASRDDRLPARDGSTWTTPDGGLPPDGGEEEREEPHSFTEDEQLAARRALSEQSADGFSDGFDPAELYAQFNDFALTHFGATEHPLVYEMMGETLALREEGELLHLSPRSVAVGFTTTLPARSYVEHGPTEALGSRTDRSERYFYQHLHYLQGLEPGATHHVQLVAYDERGHVVRSPIREITTPSLEGYVEIPAGSDTPVLLDEDGGTYLVTGDITAEGTAFEVTGNDITLDLGGHTVTYAGASTGDTSNATAASAHTGVYARTEEGRGLRILNGTLREGYVGNDAGSSESGLHAIYLDGYSDVEIAAVTALYHGGQVHAVHATGVGGRFHAHHSVWVDRGWEILDRHGSGGSRCITLPNTSGANDFEIAFNLAKRVRHTCFHNADSLHDNEVYGDSWATNGFLLGGHSKLGVDGGQLLRNKVFMTGYHGIGFGWAHQGLVIRDNLIVMESISTDRRRWYESYGDWDSLNGLRITNYGDGGQERHGLRYENNYILGRARGDAIMRGTEFYSDRTITDVVTSGGVISIVAEAETLDAAPIVAQGSTGHRREAEPMYYRGIHLVSNLANVRFGDSYGKGDNHRIEGCTIERVGDHPSYHTFVFDGTYDSRQHVVLDPVFVGGARYDDVWWRSTGRDSQYSVAWTVTLEGPAGESVVIRDRDGDEVFRGSLDSAGTLEVPLHMATVGRDPEGGDLDHLETAHTPHTVTVGGVSREVTVDERKTVSF